MVTVETYSKKREEILKLSIELEDLKHAAFKRGKEKMLALREGFFLERNGKIYDRNGYEDVDFETDYIQVTSYDTGYDLHEIFNMKLSYEEFNMSEEDWLKKLEILKADKEEKDKADKLLTEQKEKQNREIQYLKLKSEFEK